MCKIKDSIIENENSEYNDFKFDEYKENELLKTKKDNDLFVMMGLTKDPIVKQLDKLFEKIITN